MTEFDTEVKSPGEYKERVDARKLGLSSIEIKVRGNNKTVFFDPDLEFFVTAGSVLRIPAAFG